MKPVTQVLPLAVGAAASPILSRQSSPNSSCAATTEWAGFSGLKHAFVFGNSYTQTGFNFTQEPYPQPGNPLGNPGYPGYTSSNGPNWIDYLTVKYNSSLLLTYNLAYGGATVDSDLVKPYEDTVLSVKQQVLDEFVPGYTGSSPSAPGAPEWTGEDTLFAVWIGINDVGNSYYNGEDATNALYAKIFDVYSGLVDTMYEAGGRNFVFLNVPPVDRSPLITESGVEGAAEQEKAAIGVWNDKVGDMAASLKSNHSEVNVWTVDTNSVFEKVLDDPSSFPQTSGYTNTTGYCEAYENGTSEPDTLVESCGVPVNQYFWLNTLHPTYPIHDVVAEQVSKALEAGPNVIPVYLTSLYFRADIGLLISDLSVSTLQYHPKFRTLRTVNQDELQEAGASNTDVSPNLDRCPSLVHHPHDRYPTDKSLVEERSAGHMGRGLFAVKDMPAGTRILSETPLIMVPGDPSERTLAENIAAFCNAVVRIDFDSFHILLILSHDKSVEYDSQTSEAVQNWFMQTIPKEMYELDWCVPTYSKLFTFCQRNAVGLPGLGASGFFYRHGVINHSCSPNAHGYYDRVKERHQVHLLRDVKAGDQIFVSYVTRTEVPRACRHAGILAHHKFVCDCALCTSQEAEAIIHRVLALYDGLSNYMDRFIERTQQSKPPFIPRNESLEAVANAEELLSLFRHPSVDIIGPSLSLALQFCMWTNENLGDIKAAAMYAKEKLALHVRLYGFDAEDFLDKGGAFMCLRSLESKLSEMETGAPWVFPR